MAEATPLELAGRAVELASARGADQCDAIAFSHTESTVSIRLGDIEKLIEATSHSLGLRVIAGGRTAVCSTSDFTLAAFEQFVAETVELARISAPDEYAGLPEPELLASAAGDALQLYDERIESLPLDDRIDMARSCEAAALGFDSRITNSEGASLSTRVGEVALANSRGFAAGYPATSISLSTEALADDEDGKKRNAWWFSAERNLRSLLDPETLGRIAAQRAVDQLGARKTDTKRVPVIFEPMMAARLAGDVAGCATGGALYRGATFLAGRTGEAIGSPLVTIVDDPTQPARAGSRPFDGEGVTAHRNVLFQEGRFEGFLFDCYTARRMDARTTGSAQRGVSSLPEPGPANLIFEPGETPAEDIVADTREGLLVTALMGFGFNPTTGDYSRGVGGFWIENGQIAYPVAEANISGDVGSMLAGVDAVGSDLTWFGSSAAPTVRVAEMTVSGV
ncbi:MAG: TldD/PmbA family protein [Chloroflexi bacterium]|nr:TldD/PmbA family protein [Chloroflexota bacterium]